MTKRSGRGLVFMVSTMGIAAVSAVYAYYDRQSTQQVCPMTIFHFLFFVSGCTMD